MDVVEETAFCMIAFTSLFCCCGDPLVMLQPASSGFQRRLKTNGSPGIPEVFSTRLEMLRLEASVTEQLWDSQLLQGKTVAAGLPGPPSVSQLSKSPLICILVPAVLSL